MNTKGNYQYRSGIAKCMLAAAFLAGTVSCQDNLGISTPAASEGKQVQVELSLGFDNAEDGITSSGTTRSTGTTSVQNGAFVVTPTPKVQTRLGERATEITQPDALYELHVIQYKQDGTLIGSVKYTAGGTPIGTILTYTLTEANDCQLVIFARGQGNTSPAINGSLSNLQSLSMPSNLFANIPTSGATQEQMNKMPYILHLPHVNVTSDGKLQSITGAHDARLLLKRLAVKLIVNWEYNVSGYKLKQLLLQSIPLNYTIVDKPESDGTYPSVVSQFTTLEATITDANAAKGTYSCWVPANVRGENASATSDIQRTKANAPMGSSFLNFIAAHTTDIKKKLDYRVYIGSGASTDFNLYWNKDYVYDVNFKHVGIPTADRRVTYIDPVPASENNGNLVPTANCFMVVPGGAFCFDPFTYRQNGKDVTNTDLQTWTNNSRGGIKSIKVLWQTRENGDVGDPVLGIVNNESDHTNIVDIRRIDGKDISTNPITASGQGRIYCRVAANTTGGNGLIAALDKNGEILWSWHIWVTDYSPSAAGNESVLDNPNKRKQKYIRDGCLDQLPMMDRNLGAIGGHTEIPAKAIDKTKASGLLYQRGRKDPFLASFTTKSISELIYSNSSPTPIDGLQNMYGPDGYSYIPREFVDTGVGNYEAAYKTPYTIYTTGGDTSFHWSSMGYTATWDVELKNFHDPSPAGWRIPSRINFKPLFENDNWETSSTSKTYMPRGISSGNRAAFMKAGAAQGYILRYDNDANHYTYFWLTGYNILAGKYVNIGQKGWILAREFCSAFAFGVDENFSVTVKNTITSQNWYPRDAHAIRCIQEKE